MGITLKGGNRKAVRSSPRHGHAPTANKGAMIRIVMIGIMTAVVFIFYSRAQEDLKLNTPVIVPVAETNSGFNKVVKVERAEEPAVAKQGDFAVKIHDDIPKPDPPAAAELAVPAAAEPADPVVTTTTIADPNQKWDSSKCVVIGLAVNYGISEYRVFVGSLRATGYTGHIILGISQDASQDVREYLDKHKVTTKYVTVTRGPGGCTFYNTTTVDNIPSLDQKCTDKYPDYKIQWGRFPLARDWLQECTDCTDGVMLTDVRDAYFQSDPFAFIEKPAPLFVFQEIYPELSAEHWLTAIPTRKCRGLELTQEHPMLCSGSIMGSREGIIEYVNIMQTEMDWWASHVECRSDMIGDDQSIHNYLYYAGKLNQNTVSVPYRTGAINVIGWIGAKIFYGTIAKIHEAGGGDGGRFKDKYDAEGFVNNARYHGSELENWKDWLGPEWNLTDPETGMLLNLDGRPSPQVHQFDRFGYTFIRPWLDPMVDIWNKELDEKLEQQQQQAGQ